jgi:hypothetical protein
MKKVNDKATVSASKGVQALVPRVELDDLAATMIQAALTNPATRNRDSFRTTLTAEKRGAKLEILVLKTKREFKVTFGLPGELEAAGLLK